MQIFKIKFSSVFADEAAKYRETNLLMGFRDKCVVCSVSEMMRKLMRNDAQLGSNCYMLFCQNDRKSHTPMNSNE